MNDRQFDHLVHEVFALVNTGFILLALLFAIVLLAFDKFVFGLLLVLLEFFLVSLGLASICDGYNRKFWQLFGCMDDTPLSEKREQLEVDWK